MSGEKNGSDVVVQINKGTDVAPEWMTVASQRNVVIQEGRTTIDTSSKESANETHLPGRYSSTFTLDHCFVDGAGSLQELRWRHRNGTQVRVRTVSLGENDEQALCTITNLTTTFADQQTATVNMSFKLSGQWEPAE